MASGGSFASSVSSRQMSVDMSCDFCKEELSGTIEMLACYHIFHEACVKEALREQDENGCSICKSKVTVISPEISEEASGSKRKRKRESLQNRKTQSALTDALVIIAAQKDLSDEKITRRFLH